MLIPTLHILTNYQKYIIGVFFASVSVKVQTGSLPSFYKILCHWRTHNSNTKKTNSYWQFICKQITREIKTRVTNIFYNSLPDHSIMSKSIQDIAINGKQLFIKKINGKQNTLYFANFRVRFLNPTKNLCRTFGTCGINGL